MGSFKYGHKRQGKPRAPLKHCGHSAVAYGVLNTPCTYAGEQHFLAFFGNKMPLKGGGRNKKRRNKVSFEPKYGAILSLSQGKKGLFLKLLR